MNLWNALKLNHNHKRRRKHRHEAEALTSRDDDSDAELARNERRTTLEGSRSVPSDLSLHAGIELETDDATAMKDAPQETAAPTAQREDVASNSLHPPSGRTHANGAHSPGSRPAAFASSPKHGDKSLNSSHNKKRSNWFSLSYKQKSDEFHKLFKDIPADERLLLDYSCAMQKDLLVHGRLYISQNWICFYASILFKWETSVMIPCKDIRAITKEKTARVIPNAVQITTATDKYFFSSFSSRDKSYLLMFRIWQNTLLDQMMTNQQIWQWVHDLYGSQLGLTESDDDYEVPVRELVLPYTQEVSSVAGSDDVVSNGSTASTVQPPARAATPEVVRSVEASPAASPATAPAAAKRSVSSDSDTTESEDPCVDLEVHCPVGHEHSDWQVMDVHVNFSVDQIFDLLFTDSTFFASHLTAQKTTDAVLGEWSEQPDADGLKHRIITYTVAVNASFGPKKAASTEKQRIQKDSKPGAYYCIDCDTFTDPALPYAENFYVWNRYCISRVTKSSCRVIVRSKIVYVKSVFSLVRGIIEKNVRNGVHGYFRPLGKALTQESEKMVPNPDQPRKKKRFVRHRAASTLSRLISRPSNGAIHGTKSVVNNPEPPELETTKKTAHISSTVRVMSALLIFLVMFNLLLFFKLWSLETRHAAMQLATANSGMYNHQELLDLLNKQKLLYDKDMTHWKSTLESSTKLIHQLQESVEEIKAQQPVEHSSRQVPAQPTTPLEGLPSKAEL